MSTSLFTVFLLLFVAPATVFAQTDRRVEAIKGTCQRIDEAVAQSEQEPEYSNIYTTELAVNKGNGSYPAVGIYRPVVKFHYTYGDREKHPYPNRLVKIVVSVARSDRNERSEFCFDEAEQLVFYFEKKDEIERRIYFAAAKPIQFEQGDRRLSLRAKSQAAIIAAVLKEKTNLVAIFKRSLGF